MGIAVSVITAVSGRIDELKSVNQSVLCVVLFASFAVSVV